MKRTMILSSLLTIATLGLAALALQGHGAGEPNDSSSDVGGETAPGRALGARRVAEELTTRAAVTGDTSFSYHLSDKAQLRFSWTSRTETRLGSTDGAMEAGPTFALNGELLVTGLGMRGDDLVVELRLSRLVVHALGAAVEAGNQAATILKRDLEAGTLVRLSRGGRILGYGFAEGLQPESRNWLRVIACAARVALSAASEVAWTCEEADETGIALCEQRWTGAEVDHRRGYARKKLRYVDATERAPRPQIDAATSGVFDALLGWPSRAQGEQHARLEVAAMGLRVESRMTFTCELADVVAGVACQARDRVTDASLTGAGDVATARSEAIASDYRQMLEGVSTDRLIAALLELARGDLASPELMAARESLVWALKLWPERVADVLRAVQSGTLEDQGLMVLLAALGAAKHEAAQKALVECCAENQGEKTRVFALRGMFQLDRPSAATIDATSAAARGTGSELVASTGLLLLGRFAESDRKQVASLLALEGEAASGKRLDSWLQALGNAHSEDALPAVQRHSGAEDVHVRAAALDALSGMPGDAALKTLAERASQESDPEVRAHAAAVLASREEPTTLRLVDELLVREQDADVRIAALRSLSRKLPNPEARHLIVRAAETDAVARVRTFASEALR